MPLDRIVDSRVPALARRAPHPRAGHRAGPSGAAHRVGLYLHPVLAQGHIDAEGSPGIVGGIAALGLRQRLA